jgi:hypothetical protein
MAGAYADAPEIAVRRMRWARGVVQTLFDPTQRSQIAARWAGPTRASAADPSAPPAPRALTSAQA